MKSSMNPVKAGEKKQSLKGVKPDIKNALIVKR